jgi:DNA gyrase inhibitor GyrI
MTARGIDPKAIRWFGFNNPSPSPGSPNYGYEVWITVGPEVTAGSEGAPGEVKLLDFGGGLYAVTHCVGAFNLPQVWEQLAHWREDSPYKQAHHQWLEELHNFMERDPAKLIFDIYLPIAE